jgi:hypothetical protein
MPFSGQNGGFLMAFKQMIEMYDFLENPKVDGKAVASLLKRRGADRAGAKL